MKIILITHHKGGVGKSVLTLNLAKNIGRSSEVVIIDFDTQGSLHKTREHIDIPVLPYTEIVNEKGKIDLSKLECEYLFIDTPPYIISYFDELCKLADVIVVPMKAGAYDYLSVVETIENIKSNNSLHKVLTVFTMIKANANITSEINTLVGELGVQQAQTYISDLVAYIYSTSGKLNSKDAQQQIDALSIEILKKIVNNKK